MADPNKTESNLPPHMLGKITAIKSILETQLTGASWNQKATQIKPEQQGKMEPFEFWPYGDDESPGPPPMAEILLDKGTLKRLHSEAQKQFDSLFPSDEYSHMKGWASTRKEERKKFIDNYVGYWGRVHVGKEGGSNDWLLPESLLMYKRIDEAQKDFDKHWPENPPEDLKRGFKGKYREAREEARNKYVSDYLESLKNDEESPRLPDVPNFPSHGDIVVASQTSITPSNGVEQSDGKPPTPQPNAIPNPPPSEPEVQKQKIAVLDENKKGQQEETPKLPDKDHSTAKRHGPLIFSSTGGQHADWVGSAIGIANDITNKFQRSDKFPGGGGFDEMPSNHRKNQDNAELTAVMKELLAAIKKLTDAISHMGGGGNRSISNMVQAGPYQKGTDDLFKMAVGNSGSQSIAYNSNLQTSGPGLFPGAPAENAGRKQAKANPSATGAKTQIQKEDALRTIAMALI